MLKHLMSGSSLLALALRDGNNDEGNDDPKAKLRAELAKGNNQQQEEAPPKKEGEEETEDEEDSEDDEDEESDEEDVDKEEETEEAKAEREKQEKITAKAQRKQDRMQRRIDEATAARRNAEAEIARLKAQIEADPEKKLTAEEVETRAEAIAAKKLADKQIEENQEKFNAACDMLQKAAKKIDKDFDEKINDIASDIGPIPSFMIGVLEDLEHGGEVLAFIANDDEVAENIWKLKPAKMTTELVKIHEKIIEAKKKPKKEISRVEAPGEPVKGNRNSQSTVISSTDVKDMDRYVAKRQAQMMERKKARGY